MPKAYEAGGTIRVNRFVKIGAADHVILESDANELVLGITGPGGRTAPIPDVVADPPEAAQAGEHATVLTAADDEDVQIHVGSGGLTRGIEVCSDANGSGIAIGAVAATVYHVGAIALESASAGELCRVQQRTYTHTTPA